VLKDLIEAALSSRSAETWLGTLKHAGIPCGPMNDIAAVMADPRVRARNMRVELALPSGEGLLTAGSPVKFADSGELRATPAPALDEHRAALLRELGLTSA